MLQSMTGFGEARAQRDDLTVAAEIRGVNGRHLKLSIRASDPYGLLEPDLERLLRQRLRRGTIQLNLRVETVKRPEDYQLNLVAIRGYYDQLKELDLESWRALPAADMLPSLLPLPGVVEPSRRDPEAIRAAWPVIERVVAEALDRYDEARANEGAAMKRELVAIAESIARLVEQVAARGPEVVAGYRDRLTERINALTRDQGIRVEPSDLIREVAIFADRCDVSEEVTRLQAHLEQFRSVLDAGESPGRKLEFVTQEMGREVNTIGSKANDVAISRLVFEMKGLLERVRELIPNIE